MDLKESGQLLSQLCTCDNGRSSLHGFVGVASEYEIHGSGVRKPIQRGEVSWQIDQSNFVVASTVKEKIKGLEVLGKFEQIVFDKRNGHSLGVGSRPSNIESLRDAVNRSHLESSASQFDRVGSRAAPKVNRTAGGNGMFFDDTYQLWTGAARIPWSIIASVIVRPVTRSIDG